VQDESQTNDLVTMCGEDPNADLKQKKLIYFNNLNKRCGKAGITNSKTEQIKPEEQTS